MLARERTRLAKALGISAGAATGGVIGAPAGLLAGLALLARKGKPPRISAPRNPLKLKRWLAAGGGLEKELVAGMQKAKRRAAKGAVAGAGSGAVAGGVAGHYLSKKGAAISSQLTPKSTSLRGYSYDPKTQSLVVTFKNGGTYRYSNVPPNIARAMKRNKSVGKTLHRRVKKGGFEYKKMAEEKGPLSMLTEPLAQGGQMVGDMVEKHEEPLSLALGTALGASSRLTLGAGLGGKRFAAGLGEKLKHPKAGAGTLRKVVHTIRKLPKGSKLRRQLVRQLTRGGLIGGGAGMVAGGLFGLQVAKGHGRQKEMRKDLDRLRRDVAALKKTGKDLTARGRKQVKEKNFALPGDRYPIHDRSHARNALARVAQHGSPEEQAMVRAKVHAKYPGIGKKANGDMIAYFRDHPEKYREYLKRKKAGLKGNATQRFVQSRTPGGLKKKASLEQKIAYRLVEKRRQIAKLAGAAKKHTTWNGIALGLEYETGDTRSGVNGTSGEKWSRTMKDSYGYVPGTKGKGADGDAIDIYLAPEPVDGAVYKVRQMKRDGGYDEDKFMLGYDSATDAKKAFLRNMPEWAFGSMTGMSLKRFSNLIG